ncbi:AMP-binding protein [Catellatospora bangladeshensis]|uniref:Acyl-CoA synthetase n=1 Tax=Catellatospora bangladeshensis TaxID=310355 RepID=A0A8J3JJM5_9ACTN|nr:AMP-binding protein [Catellatospora bangladeshensis]GIF81622.1 acyl-CoA synthetase [Catellatospora bangladeshensis]
MDDGVRSYVWRALDSFAAYGDAEAIRAPGRTLTYHELRTAVLTMATALHEQGVRAGTSVAVLVGNPCEAIFLQLALHLLGCRSVWMIPSAPHRHRVEFLRLAEADVFVYDARTHDELGRELLAEVPHVSVLCLGPGGLGPDLLAREPADAAPIGRDGPGAEPHSLFQTGGTTGTPKLVLHRHAFFQTLALFSDHWTATGGHRLRHLAVSAFWHVSAQVPVLMTLFTGGTLVMHDKFEAQAFLDAVEQDRITSILLPPPLLYQFLDDPRLDACDTSSLQMISCGGSAAAPVRLAQAVARFGPVLRPVYGMTEAPFITAQPNLTLDPAHPERLGSCGLPYGDMRVEIRDSDGTVLPAGGTGDVWIKGSLMMDGYHGQPELTAETIVDGWLRTGDIGRLDADGYLFLVDRAKDMIITGYGSTNIYSRPVEDALAAHPQVRAAAVIGVPADDTGEAVHAYVVAEPGADITAEEVRDFVIGELNEMWAPRTVAFVDALPLTAMGKVDKKALRARWLAAAPAAA